MQKRLNYTIKTLKNKGEKRILKKLTNFLKHFKSNLLNLVFASSIIIIKKKKNMYVYITFFIGFFKEDFKKLLIFFFSGLKSHKS
jgi:hypothetical protein